MKNRKAVTVLLEHFLHHHRIYHTTAGGILRHLRRRANTKCFFLAFVLSLASLPLIVGEKAQQTGLTIPLLGVLGLFLVILIVRCEMMTWSSWKEEKKTVAKLQTSRAAFKKCFGHDVLKCNDAQLLSLHVKKVLGQMASTIDSSNAARDFEAATIHHRELRELWDSGNEFVPVPSYPGLFREK